MNPESNISKATKAVGESRKTLYKYGKMKEDND
jgi:ACT domain-containing protein